MSAGTPVQPDYEAMSADWTAYKNAIEGSIKAASRIAWMFAPHEQSTPNMTVRLEAGALLAKVTLGEVAAQSTGTITAPTGTDHRIDRVVIDALTGAASVIAGTPGALPRSAPAITTGKLPICQVALAYNTTAITNGLITDERVLGGAVGEAFPVNSIYQNLGTDPATELGYGAWISASAGFISRYPLQQTTIYVKATIELYAAHIATNPATPLTGASTNNWLANNSTNQRFHIDPGFTFVIKRIYYENYHNVGGDLVNGAKNFTLWGSNNAAAFAELTYGTDTNWTQIGGALQFNQHSAADAADPMYITVSNTIPYRYYAIKIADSWGGAYIGIRRIELQDSPYLWIRSA